MQRLKTDPARFEVVKNALTCAAEEMKIVLAKTAYSPLLKVAGDYSCGIFDIAGNMVAQGPDLPIHLGSMPDAVRAVVRAFPRRGAGRRVHPQRSVSGRLAPAGRERRGARLSRGSPARVRLRARALARYRQRHAGQLRRGDRNLRRGTAPAADTPVSRRQARSWRSRRSSSPMCARPTERLGDLRAQVAANRRAAVRLAALAAKYGTDTLLGIMQEVLDYSETMMRAALRALPDGEAEFTDIFDGDGVIAPGETEDADVQGEAAHHQARRHDHRRFHRLRSAGRGADERAADGHCVGRVLRAEDDCRSEEPDPAEFRLLAAGDGHRAARVAW